MSKKIRIIVVDDHPFFRHGVVQWINQQSDLTCCGEADSIAQAKAVVASLTPDVILLDLQLKDGDGLDLTMALSQEYPAVRIVILSHRDEAVYAHRALRAGARAYIMKSEGTELVKAAIQAVMKGEIYVSRPVAARALQKLLPDPGSSEFQLDRLSDREVQVFQLLGAACGTRDIAALLKISPKTVETYRENLKHKLHLADAEALVRAAKNWVEHGKLDPSK